jgi:hypothetical protein
MSASPVAPANFSHDHEIAPEVVVVGVRSMLFPASFECTPPTWFVG